MAFALELVDHVGMTRRKKLADGTIQEPHPVQHDQMLVKADGIHIGYMGKPPASWLALIVWVDEETKAEVIESIEAKTGTKLSGVTMIPDPDLDEPEDDEEDEDLDDLDFENEDF